MTHKVSLINERGELKSEQIQTIDRSPYARVIQTQKRSHEDGQSMESITGYDNFDDWGNIGFMSEEKTGAGSANKIEAYFTWERPNDSLYLHSHPGTVTVYGYDKNGNKTSIPLRKREGRYDNKGNLVELKQYYEENVSTSHKIGYDNWGNLSYIEDPRGERISYAYDSTLHQFPVTISQSGSGTKTYSGSMEWDYRLGVKTKETDVNGNSMRYDYDERGRLIHVWSPRDTGRVAAVSYEYYTPEGTNWYAITKNKVLFDASDESLMLTVLETDGLGRVIQTAKNGEKYENGSKKRGWNVSGQVTYDEKGRTIEEGQNDFVAGELLADLFNNARYELRNPSYKEYDALDRVTQVRIPDKNAAGGYAVQTTSYRINDEGSYTLTTDPLGNKSAQTSDWRGNIIKVERFDKTDKKLTQATYEYNAMGELLSAFDAQGNPVSVTYDMLGRKLSLESKDSGKKEYFYDEAGNLIKELDAVLRRKGEEIRYEYDGLNRLVKIDYPATTDVTYRYGEPGEANNAAGKIVSLTDETGTITYKYGQLGEVVEESRVINRVGKSGGTTEKRAVMQYESDYLGRMQKITYPDGEEVTYGYDWGGQVTSAKGVKNGIAFPYVNDIGYDEFGQRVYIEYGNDVKTWYTYDEDRRWLSNIKTDNQARTYQNMDYRFDLVGNVAGYTNDSALYTTSQNYSYDGLYQLTSVSGTSINRPNSYEQYTATYSQAYTFDEAGLGNMVNKRSESLVTGGYSVKGDNLNYNLNYEYDENYAHRVKKIGDRYYTYDANGNVVKEEGEGGQGGPVINPEIFEDEPGIYRNDYGWGLAAASGGGGSTPGGVYRRSYSWNERNLLADSVDSSYTVNYKYGADGQRALKFARNATGTESETLYFNKMWEWRYDGLINSERNNKHIFLGDTRVTTKIVSPNGTTSQETGSEYFYHGDHLGSAQLVTDYRGNEYQRIEYTPYGETWIENRVKEDGNTLPYKFTAKERDEETGLYYVGARYLDSRTSRWLSTDPALMEYIPGAPVNDEAKKANQNLPGMGGVFNVVNFHLYHYAGNNPVKYTDPDGKAPRDMTEVQRNSYKAAITALKSNITSIPARYDCTDVTLYAYNKAMKAATGESNAYGKMFHENTLLSKSKYGLTDIQAKDQNPLYGNKNVLFYSGSGGDMAYSQTNYDKSFDSINVEIGTVAILEPFNSAGGFTGHTMTVVGIETDANGVRQRIDFLEGGMDHPARIISVTRNESLDIYSDTKFIGWAEWRSGDY